MKLSRRGFIGGVFAALVARKLPKPKPAPVVLPQKWEMMIYGTPIMMVRSRKTIVLPDLGEDHYAEYAIT